MPYLTSLGDIQVTYWKPPDSVRKYNGMTCLAPSYWSSPELLMVSIAHHQVVVDY